MKCWYVLHTKTLAEERVASVLDQRDIRTYLPISSDRSNGQDDGRPLFPGYLFARLDLESGNPANWKWVPGLRYLVSFGDVAVPVPDDVIKVIERKVRDMRSTRPDDETRFKQGDMVHIKDGPFANMLAVFDRTCTPSKRVQIMLEALDRSYRLTIEPDKLEMAQKDTKGRAKRPRRTRGRGRPIRR